MPNLEVLKLPWEIQTALASGYAAYMLAYTGIRMRHSAIDTAFITLVFSLIATLVLLLTSTAGAIIGVPAAFLSTCTVGFVWRKWGRSAYRAFLRYFDLTWADDDQSALETLLANSKHRVYQVGVLLDDGTWLRCDDTTKFSDAPFGSCLLGPAGDVALYLTHIEPNGADPQEMKTVRDPKYGDRITYVPASRIKMITLRHV